MSNTMFPDGAGGVVTAPGYVDINQTLILPYPSLLDVPPFITGTDVSQSREVVAHETTHHVVNNSNPDIVGQTINGDVFAGAFNEAMSDVMAAAYEEHKGVARDQAWVIGDSVMTQGIRDSTVDRNFAF